MTISNFQVPRPRFPHMLGRVPIPVLVVLVFIFIILGVRLSKPSWPSDVSVINYQSVDGQIQRALFWRPQSEAPVPLLVALHTWSGDYRQELSIPYLEFSKSLGWAFLHPDFRGANNHTDAMGSGKAIQDVLLAMDHVKSNTAIDADNIYLIGFSGGGHMALLLAGQFPQLWAGVSAWSPITDLAKWVEETKDGKWQAYAEQVISICGGDPNIHLLAKHECRRRSPITYLQPNLGLPIALYSGIHDGSSGSVPVSHSLRAFNGLVDKTDRINVSEFENINNEAVLFGKIDNGKQIADRNIVYEKTSGQVSVTLFDGGHEILYKPAFDWFFSLYKN